MSPFSILSGHLKEAETKLKIELTSCCLFSKMIEDDQERSEIVSSNWRLPFAVQPA